MALKVVALAGGVGGAKLGHGLAMVVPPEDLTVIVNTGDDFVHLGLTICPDLDTVLYTLAGVANPSTGWGRAEDTWNALEAISSLRGPTWFRLGDKDVGLHLERTRRLANGHKLSNVTSAFCAALDVAACLLPMSDDPVRTVVETAEGPLAFQEYFVARACVPPVRGFRFEGAENARPAPGVLEALEEATVVVLSPSNPFVSLDPILAVPGILEIVQRRRVVGVSPIVGGRALKGPAAKMLTELGLDPSPMAIADHFRGVLSGIVIDRRDAKWEGPIRRMGIEVRVAQTVMRGEADRRKLAAEVVAFAGSLHSRRTD